MRRDRIGPPSRAQLRSEAVSATFQIGAEPPLYPQNGLPRKSARVLDPPPRRRDEPHASALGSYATLGAESRQGRQKPFLLWPGWIPIRG